MPKPFDQSQQLAGHCLSSKLIVVVWELITGDFSFWSVHFVEWIISFSVPLDLFKFTEKNYLKKKNGKLEFKNNYIFVLDKNLFLEYLECKIRARGKNEYSVWMCQCANMFVKRGINSYIRLWNYTNITVLTNAEFVFLVGLNEHFKMFQKFYVQTITRNTFLTTEFWWSEWNFWTKTWFPKPFWY